MDSYSTRANLVRSRRRSVVAAVAAGTFLVAAGCNNAGQGALSGGAMGALGGLAIGSLTGNAGAGAAIGAIAGAATGAVIGDQNERNDNRARNQYNDNW